MTIAELGAIGEFIGSVAVLVTLVYLSVQVRQNTHHARAQMGHSGWLLTTSNEVAVMGDDPAEVLAKADLDQEPLTPRDLKILDAYFRSLALQLGRVEHTNSLRLEIYSVEQTAQAFVDQFNCRVGKAWWVSNREFVDLLAPTIAACVEELFDEPGCRSRAESFKAFQRALVR